MAKQTLSDTEAKAILLKWPNRTKNLWSTPGRAGYWIRAQPKSKKQSASSPTISTPGAKLFTTQPDGMWVFLSDTKYADVVAIEASTQVQNLGDKRSRYAATVRSLILRCPLKWLLEDVPLPNKGKAPRWKACRTVLHKPRHDLELPIRYLRVLFAIPNSLYETWAPNNAPDGHEFFCKHSSLDSYNSQTMQAFLKQMSPAAHYLAKGSHS